MLRGAISNREDWKKQRTLSSARLIVTENDESVFADILVDANLDNSIYGEPFPENASGVFSVWRYMQPCSLELEAAIQFRRLIKYKNTVIPAVRKLVELNKNLLDRDYDRAISTAASLVAEYGYSAAVIRKILFIYAQAEINGIALTSDDSPRAIQSLMDDIYLNRRRRLLNLYTSYLVDLFDNRSDLFSTIDVQARMNREASRRGKDEFALALIEKTRFACMPATTQNNVSLYLLGCSSLLDVFVEFSCMSFDDKHPSMATALYETQWAAELLLELTDQEVSIEAACQGSEDAEEEAYKLASAIPENRNLNEFRFALDSQLVCREETKITGKGRSQGFFPSDLTIEDLVDSPTEPLSQIDHFQNSQSSIMLRSFGVLYALNCGRDFSSLSADGIRNILGQTTGFSQTLTIDEVLQIRDLGDNIHSPIVSFLALIMLNERDPSDDREFDLRMTFQTLLISEYQENILNFLSWMHSRTPGLCDAVVALCDIAFLERLYLIYGSYSEVLEQRQAICRWAYEKLNNSAYLELAEQLEVDAKVREIRDELDDTRIYVEEMRYKQWAAENVTALLLRYQRQVEILGLITSDTFVKSERTNKVYRASKDQIQSDFYLYHAVDVAFREFCHNKTFGIDSYLSRRIRHGSLVGQLQAPIRVLVDQFIDENKSDILEGQALELKKIYRQYSTIVHDLKDERLQFKAKTKPSGLFSSDAFDTAARMEAIHLFRYQLPRLFESGVTASMLVDAFPAVCWNLLEVDLNKVREEIKRTYRTRVRQVLRQVKAIAPENTKWVSLQNNMEQSAHDNYNEVLKWFYRPERSSMSVSIAELAEVVKKEINAYHPEAQVQYEIQGESEGTVSGSAYHTIYDIFFVLFDNASKYADTSSPIKVNAAFVSGDDEDAEVRVSVSTRLHRDEKSRVVSRAIESSLDDSPRPDAMISEGKSGLSKVRWLIENYPKPGKFAWCIEHQSCIFEFSLPVVLVTKGGDKW